jgi:hypothetical protein
MIRPGESGGQSSSAVAAGSRIAPGGAACPGGGPEENLEDLRIRVSGFVNPGSIHPRESSPHLDPSHGLARPLSITRGRHFKPR